MVRIFNEKLEIHNILNPKIWRNDKLIPLVRDKIFKIVNEFIKSLEIDINYVDVWIVGSNASYNYTDNSDLDVHVIVNYDLLNSSKEVIQAMYNSERSNFNNNYDISIRGINVELYVEDINSNTVSNGIYSVIKNEWVKFPSKINNVKQVNLEPELSNLKSEIKDIIFNSDSSEDVENTINSLYMLRKNSLATDGEYGKGNQIFKEIRNLGLLDNLKDKMYKLTSLELSIK